MTCKVKWTLGVTLAAGALVIGCGDDEGNPKGDYLAAGDQICAVGTFEIGRAAQQRYGQPSPPPKDAPEFAKQVIAPTLQNRVVVELRKLTPPEGDDATVDAIYDALEDGIRRLRSNPALITQPGVGGAFDDASRLAQQYGFKQCGSS